MRAPPTTWPPIDAVASRIGDADDREHVGAQERSGEALHGAGRNQRGACRRRGADCRRDGEDDKAQREGAPPADAVAHPAGGHETDGEAQPISGYDPFEPARTCVQVALDRRQGNIHDEEIEHDHERSSHQDRERRPLALQPAVSQSLPSGECRFGRCDLGQLDVAHERSSGPDCVASRLPMTDGAVDYLLGKERSPFTSQVIADAHNRRVAALQ
jgi:hypothetical protein